MVSGITFISCLGQDFAESLVAVALSVPFAAELLASDKRLRKVYGMGLGDSVSNFGQVSGSV